MQSVATDRREALPEALRDALVWYAEYLRDAREFNVEKTRECVEIVEECWRLMKRGESPKIDFLNAELDALADQIDAFVRDVAAPGRPMASTPLLSSALNEWYGFIASSLPSATEDEDAAAERAEGETEALPEAYGEEDSTDETTERGEELAEDPVGDASKDVGEPNLAALGFFMKYLRTESAYDESDAKKLGECVEECWRIAKRGECAGIDFLGEDLDALADQIDAFVCDLERTGRPRATVLDYSSALNSWYDFRAWLLEPDADEEPANVEAASVDEFVPVPENDRIASEYTDDAPDDCDESRGFQIVDTEFEEDEDYEELERDDDMAGDERKRTLKDYLAYLRGKGVPVHAAPGYRDDLQSLFFLCDSGDISDVDLLSQDRRSLEKDVETILGNARFQEKFASDAERVKEALRYWIDFRAPEEEADLENATVVFTGKSYAMNELYELYIVYVLKKRSTTIASALNYLRELKLRQRDALDLELSPATLVDDDLSRVDLVFDKLCDLKSLTPLAKTSYKAWNETLNALKTGVPIAPREISVETLMSQYKDYLVAQGNLESLTISDYVRSMRLVGDFVLRKKDAILYRLLFSTDSGLVAKATVRLKSIKGFMKFSRIQHHHPSTSLNRWFQFISSLNIETGGSETPKTEELPDSVLDEISAYVEYLQEQRHLESSRAEEFGEIVKMYCRLASRKEIQAVDFHDADSKLFDSKISAVVKELSAPGRSIAGANNIRLALECCVKFVEWMYPSDDSVTGTQGRSSLVDDVKIPDNSEVKKPEEVVETTSEATFAPRKLSSSEYFIGGRFYTMDRLYDLFVKYLTFRRRLKQASAENYLRSVKLSQDDAKKNRIDPPSLVCDDLESVAEALDALEARVIVKSFERTALRAWLEFLGALQAGDEIKAETEPIDVVPENGKASAGGLIDNFKDYLKNETNLAGNTVNNYVGAMRHIRGWLKNKKARGWLFSSDYKRVRKTIKVIKQKQSFLEFNKKMHRQTGAALRFWIQFIRSQMGEEGVDQLASSKINAAGRELFLLHIPRP